MAVGEGCDTDREVAEAADQGDELVGVVEALRVGHPWLAEPALRVTAQGQDVADPAAAYDPTMLRSSATEWPTHVR